MSNIYHATPYDISAAGFFFHDYEEYMAKAQAHRNEAGDPVEEYEIQFIDGDNYTLFEGLSINQANLEQWFDDFEYIDGDDYIKAVFMAEYLGYDMETILERMDDIHLFEGTAIEYAEEYIDDTGMLAEMPENLRFYFDTEAFARDMLLGGDITEVTIDGTGYIIQEF